MEPRNPYAKSIQYQSDKRNFNTTYGLSYQDLPTWYHSPTYDKFREAKLPVDKIAHFPYDRSPYPMARDNYPLVNKKPYKLESFDEFEYERMAKAREERSRFDDEALRKGQYEEPMPSNRHGGQYGEFERYETARNHMEREQGGHGEQRREGNAKFMKSQYDDLVAAGHENEHDDLRPAVCNKCFRENVCMYRLGCQHQYCDECMGKMDSSDNPFRDAIRMHYCCDLCRKWTAETKLIRTDPYGRRLMKFHDVGYFKTS